jgi:hypothetical protein
MEIDGGRTMNKVEIVCSSPRVTTENVTRFPDAIQTAFQTARIHVNRAAAVLGNDYGRPDEMTHMTFAMIRHFEQWLGTIGAEGAAHLLSRRPWRVLVLNGFAAHRGLIERHVRDLPRVLSNPDADSRTGHIAGRRSVRFHIRCNHRRRNC